MSDKPLELEICPKCGSTEYLENCPAPGKSICADCSHEIIKITLKEIEETYSLKHTCPFCGQKCSEADIVYLEDHITVYKCRGCQRLDGYLVFPRISDSSIGIYDEDHDGKTVSIAQKEGKPIFSPSKAKELAKTLQKRENDPKEKGKKKLYQLVKEKTRILETIGVTHKTVEKATLRVEYFINKDGELTDRQLRNMFYAAVYAVQEEIVRSGSLSGVANLTERTMQNAFGIDRKTIRKLKKRFESSFIC